MANRPSVAPDWATDVNHPAGSDDWSGQPNKVLAGAGRIGSGFTPGEKFPVEWLNERLNNHGQWIDLLDAGAGAFAFGNGSDGSATADGSSAVPGMTRSGSVYTMTRACFFTTLTVGAAQIDTAGFPLFCNTELVTNNAASKIRANGGAGGAGAAGTGGAAGAGAVGAWLLGGGNGGRGTDTLGSRNNTDAPNITDGLGGNGGAAGTGSGGTGIVSAAGTVTAPSASLGSILCYAPRLAGHVVGGGSVTAVHCGAGGGGGGGSGGGASGGGGGGGGYLFIAAKKLTLNAITDLEARGGSGGNAQASGNPGGGGGGGGGVVEIAFDQSSFSAASFTPANNAPGGAGGALFGIGAAGSSGANGTVVVHQVSASTATVASPSPSPHTEQGYSAITTGTGNTHEYLDVSWSTPFDAATGASGYQVVVQISLTSATDEPIGWALANKTTTGFRILFSDSFNGEVRWKAE